MNYINTHAKHANGRPRIEMLVLLFPYFRMMCLDRNERSIFNQVRIAGQVQVKTHINTKSIK